MVSKTAVICHAVTSIILATIMVAGGVTFAIPGAVPEAAAQSSNANLYVSAENSAFDNVFTGLNVVEVVVRDPDRTVRSGSDIAAEPRVTVDGDWLRMVQGNDGSWYGYFAEQASIDAIDSDTDANTNTDTITDAISYGVRCEPEGLTDTEYVYAMCAIGGDHPVIRTPKTINNADNTNKAVPNLNFGSIGLQSGAAWPFIQVYDFDDESDIVVEYEKGGDAQSVTLYYDSDPDEYGTGLELGRDRYPRGGGVIMTMTDLAMNVDPTDSDTWTFTTADDGAYYYLFNDDGVCQDGSTDTIDRRQAAMIDRNVEGIDDNLYLTIDPNKDGSTVLEFVVPHQGNQNECARDGTAMGLMRYINK